MGDLWGNLRRRRRTDCKNHMTVETHASRDFADGPQSTCRALRRPRACLIPAGPNRHRWPRSIASKTRSSRPSSRPSRSLARRFGEGCLRTVRVTLKVVAHRVAGRLLRGRRAVPAGAPCLAATHRRATPAARTAAVAAAAHARAHRSRRRELAPLASDAQAHRRARGRRCGRAALRARPDRRHAVVAQRAGARAALHRPAPARTRDRGPPLRRRPHRDRRLRASIPRLPAARSAMRSTGCSTRDGWSRATRALRLVDETARDARTCSPTSTSICGAR